MKGIYQMIDPVTVLEMSLWLDNTQELYLQMLGIAKGVKKAQANGTYKSEKALNACRRLGNDTIKHYKKEFGDFSVNNPTREALALEVFDRVRTAIDEQEV